MSLKLGDSGSEVFALKQRLNRLAPSLGIPHIPMGGENAANDDSIYTEETKRAVEALQRLAVSRGLMQADDVIGIFGPKSSNALGVMEAGVSAGPMAPGILGYQPQPLFERSTLGTTAPGSSYRLPTRAGFVAPERLDVTALPPEVRSQANAQGWVMMFMPGDPCSAARGTGLNGTFYVANVRTGETHAYPAVTGGLLAEADDSRTNGPLAGCRTDYWGTSNDAVNAVYSNGRYIRNYTSTKGVFYNGVIKIDDTIPDRAGFLIHKANSRGGTIGCVGLEDDRSVAEVGEMVRRYGISNMAVLNSNYNFNRGPQLDLQIATARPAATPVDYRPVPRDRENDGGAFQPLLKVIGLLTGRDF